MGNIHDAIRRELSRPRPADDTVSAFADRIHSVVLDALGDYVRVAEGEIAFVLPQINDIELQAIVGIQTALRPLDVDARRRVLNYLLDRNSLVSVSTATLTPSRSEDSA